MYFLRYNVFLCVCVDVLFKMSYLCVYVLMYFLRCHIFLRACVDVFFEVSCLFVCMC